MPECRRGKFISVMNPQNRPSLVQGKTQVAKGTTLFSQGRCIAKIGNHTNANKEECNQYSTLANYRKEGTTNQTSTTHTNTNTRWSEPMSPPPMNKLSSLTKKQTPIYIKYTLRSTLLFSPPKKKIKEHPNDIYSSSASPPISPPSVYKKN